MVTKSDLRSFAGGETPIKGSANFDRFVSGVSRGGGWGCNDTACRSSQSLEKPLTGRGYCRIRKEYTRLAKRLTKTRKFKNSKTTKKGTEQTVRESGHCSCLCYLFIVLVFLCCCFRCCCCRLTLVCLFVFVFPQRTIRNTEKSKARTEMPQANLTPHKQVGGSLCTTAKRRRSFVSS